ncbi:SPFH domain-containing protein, partial [Pseudomonas sp. MWU12-2115]|uniref:SPFH domain-containing protein n=1 Tax=Pseudomonas sp. MWU12-2115 TaxID=2071713 RepID=UPI003221C518
MNRTVVASLDEAAINWGVKVLRYEIKDLVPPQDILHAMQAQITAEREKRARIAQSEGVKFEQITLATAAREAALQNPHGQIQPPIHHSYPPIQPTLYPPLPHSTPTLPLTDHPPHALHPTHH